VYSTPYSSYNTMCMCVWHIIFPVVVVQYCRYIFYYVRLWILARTAHIFWCVHPTRLYYSIFAQTFEFLLITWFSTELILTHIHHLLPYSTHIDFAPCHSFIIILRQVQSWYCLTSTIHTCTVSYHCILIITICSIVFSFIDRQTDRHTERHTDRHTGRQIVRYNTHTPHMYTQIPVTHWINLTPTPL